MVTVPRLETINSPDSYVVRENFEEFRDIFLPDTPRRIIGLAFNGLVEHRDWMTIRVWHEGEGWGLPDHTPEPLPGIIVAKRSHLDLPPFEAANNTIAAKSFDLAQFAILTESLINNENVVTEATRSHDVRSVRIGVIQVLRSQIN